jgi:hypothetical protein
MVAGERTALVKLPSNFPRNFSKEESEELLNCYVATSKISELGPAGMPPEQAIKREIRESLPRSVCAA